MNTVTSSRAIPVTDDAGKMLLPEDQQHEPRPGSVVLTHGHHGTAWQRHFADGMWRSTRGGAAKTWANLLTKRGLVLIYDAPERQS